MNASTRKRIDFTKLLQQKKFSAIIRYSISFHIAKLECNKGDEILDELSLLINQGTTQKEIVEIMETKYDMPLIPPIVRNSN